MATWKEMEIYHQSSIPSLVKFFDKLQPSPDSALNLVKILIAHIRTHGWSYTTAAQSLQNALSTKKINCDSLADLIICFCAYNNRPNNINASVVQVQGPNSPVFLPQTKIIQAGLRIEMNVQGKVAGVFFNSGHRVASVNRVCFDLITGNKGSQANMNIAYVPCTKMLPPPADRFSFNYLGLTHYLAIQPGSTAQGLRKYTCT